MQVKRKYKIDVGYMAFIAGLSTGIGAVRQVEPDGKRELVIYVENAGEFVVPLSAVVDVEFEKVILDGGKLDQRLCDAIGHAHDAEVPDA